MEKKFSEFKIGDLFDIKKVYGLPMSSYDKGNIPYITGTKENNGVVGFVNAPEKAVSAGNCIAIDPISGISYYQPDKFVGRGFSGASINLLYHNKLNELNGIYICSAIQKVSCKVASYANLFNSSRLKNALIKLPIKTVITPDFSVMSEIYSGGGISMSNIDTSAWREFKLEELFGKPTRGTRLIKENRIPGNIPLVTAGFNNEGIAEYIDNDEQQTFSHGITIDMFGNCFCRDYAFKADDNILVFGNQDIPEKAKLFIVTCINKITNGMYSYGQQFRMTAYNNTTIKLPVKETEEIDWDYMAERIAELEQERIAELEQERIAELDNYLKVTGLNDYELTDRDKEVLCMISGKNPEDYDEAEQCDSKCQEVA